MRIARPISDFYVAGRLMPAMFNGMAIAASFVAVLVFVGLAGGLGPAWDGIAALVVGGGLGLLIAGLLLAPYLRRFGGYTVPDFLAERFSGDTLRPLAVLAVILCSFPALATVLLGLGLIVAHAYPISLAAAVGVGVAMIFACVLIGGMRSLSLSQLAQYAVLLLAALAALVVVLWQTGTILGTESLGPDEVISRFGLQTFSHSDAINRFALIVCLAAGTASLPYLLMRSFTTQSATGARISFLASVLFAGLLCLAAPALVALFAWAGSGDGLAIAAEVLLVVGGLAGLLATGSALALSIGNTLSYDVYYKSVHPTASTERRVFVARVAVILVTAVAAIAAVGAPQETLIATGAALSLAASAFLPVLVLGIWWTRATSDAALAGMVAGLVVCLYYMIAPQLIPFAFYESSSFLSNATDAQAAAYEALRRSYYLADGATQDAVLADWEVTARAVANWWGVHWAFAGFFAVPLGFLVLMVVSLFTRAPSQDAQRLVRELREQTA